MRLFVRDKIFAKKIYLILGDKFNSVLTRNDLANIIGQGKKFYMQKQLFSVNEVHAESEDNLVTGCIVGGLIGFFTIDIIGWPCILIGIIFGGLISKISDNADIKKTKHFNNSIVNN